MAPSVEADSVKCRLIPPLVCGETSGGHTCTRARHLSVNVGTTRMVHRWCWLITTRPLRAAGGVLAHAASTAAATTAHTNLAARALHAAAPIAPPDRIFVNAS
jgi:hypothetical protein